MLARAADRVRWVEGTAALLSRAHRQFGFLGAESAAACARQGLMGPPVFRVQSPLWLAQGRTSWVR